jgi:hypothetical protein
MLASAALVMTHEDACFNAAISPLQQKHSRANDYLVRKNIFQI